MAPSLSPLRSLLIYHPSASEGLPDELPHPHKVDSPTLLYSLPDLIFSISTLVLIVMVNIMSQLG